MCRMQGTYIYVDQMILKYPTPVIEAVLSYPHRLIPETVLGQEVGVHLISLQLIQKPCKLHSDDHVCCWMRKCRNEQLLSMNVIMPILQYQVHLISHFIF
jgi:hypothetical protein